MNLISMNQFKCPKCPRSFKTQAGLRQHEVDKHSANITAQPRRVRVKAVAMQPRRRARAGLGPALAAPAFQSAGTASGATMRMAGSDLLASIALSTSKVKGGYLIAELVLNPRKFSGTRMAQFGEMHSRWRPVRFALVVQTTLPSTAGGQFMAAWASDSSEKLPLDPLFRARRMMAYRPSIVCHAWQTARLQVPSRTSQALLYCDGSGPDSDHGKIFVVMSGQPIGVTGVFNVTITLEWSIEFDSPDLAQLEASDEYLQANPDYAPYFTTGSKFIQEDKLLTLECKAAGGENSIVEFPTIEQDAYYTPLKADQLVYYKTDTEKANVGAIAKIRDSAHGWVYCFESTTQAESYVRTGDLSKVLPYRQAGPWTTGNPTWKMVRVKLEAALSNLGGVLSVNQPREPIPPFDPGDMPELVTTTYDRVAFGQMAAAFGRLMVTGGSLPVSGSVKVRGDVAIAGQPISVVPVIPGAASPEPFEVLEKPAEMDS